jgi:hypothetical protein
MHMISYVKVRSSTTYHTLLAKFGELIIKLYVLKLTMGLKQLYVWLSSLNHVEGIMVFILLGKS